MKTPFLSRKRNVVLTALFYCFLWGSAFPLVKLCMEQFGAASDLDKCLVAGLRFTLSGALLLLLGLCKDRKAGIALQKRDVGTVSFYGLLMALQYACTYMGLSRVAGSVGAVFDQLCVFLVVIAGSLLLKNDRLTWQKLLGCVLGLAGILAVSSEGFELHLNFMGEGMMTLAALFQTAAYFVAALTAKSLDAAKLVGYGQFIGGLLLTAFSLFAGAGAPQFTPLGLLLLLTLALISAAAYVLSLMPLRYFPASEVAVFNLLITVFGAIMSALLLGENILKPEYLLSLVLVAAGILLVNWRKQHG